jgi:hypothetical protein
VSSDIRLIVHKTDGSLLLCYVDHHDKAYDWAERRKLERASEDRRGAVGGDPRDGWRRSGRPVYVEDGSICSKRPPSAHPSPAFRRRSRTTSCSATACRPSGWPTCGGRRGQLLDLADHLPAEAAEALLELATGGKPQRDFPAGGGG